RLVPAPRQRTELREADASGDQSASRRRRCQVSRLAEWLPYAPDGWLTDRGFFRAQAGSLDRAPVSRADGSVGVRPELDRRFAAPVRRPGRTIRGDRGSAAPQSATC